jgi:DNA-binding transcriptional LysR family regulator
LRVNNGEAVVTAAAAGQGIAAVPTFIAQDLQAAGIVSSTRQRPTTFGFVLFEPGANFLI